MTDEIISSNDLKVNIQSKLNYYEATKGAFLHVEEDPLFEDDTENQAIMDYLLEEH